LIQNDLTGSGLPTKGYFLEEGFCDLIKGLYVAMYQTEEHKKKLLSSLGLPENFTFETLVTIVSESNTDYLVPVKYLFFGADGKATTSQNAIAALGLESLCTMEPQLFPVMLRARNKLKFLRELPKVLNRIHPGLYQELTALQKTEKDFLRGLEHIWMDVLGGKIILNKKIG